MSDFLELPRFGLVNRFQVGVTLHFLRWLQEYTSSKQQEITSIITTAQLVRGPFTHGCPSPLEWCIAGQTEADQSSFMSWCLMNGYVEDRDGNSFFAPVTTFVSHAWSFCFLDLVDTIEQHNRESMARSADAQQEAYFIDIFIVNQHIPPWKEGAIAIMSNTIIKNSLKCL